MKKYVVIVAIIAEQRFAITRYLKIARPFAFKVCKEVKDSDVKFSPVSKCNKKPASSDSIRTHDFI